MSASRAKWVCLLAVLVLVMGLAGCGGPEDLQPQQVIEKAAPAIQAANSFHFTMETAKPSKPISGIFINKADGDVAKPDKLTGDLNASIAGIPINAKVVIDGKGQYWTDPMSGQWTAIPAEFNVAQFFDPAKGITDILGSVKNLQGDGKESIDGTDSYRLKGQVPAASLKALSGEVTSTGDITTTLWIGSSDFLLRRVRLEGAFTSEEPADIVRTIEFKDYNKPVTVETPVVAK